LINKTRVLALSKNPVDAQRRVFVWQAAGWDVTSNAIVE
jgi:hypothetical protein